MSQLEEQLSKRRTFAIISHPDAGKTTLTEKFLLYSGALSEAGAVKARSGHRAATSDWMEMEKDGAVINYEGDAWPLPEDAFSHPRSNGTFAKILRSYVRERKLMTMSEAIRKMSLMPAQTLEDFVPQMKKKGRLQEGMDADIVVFDGHPLDYRTVVDLVLVDG